jgi:hypothetical protein
MRYIGAIVKEAEYNVDGCDDIHSYLVLLGDNTQVRLTSDRSFVVGDTVNVSISIKGKIH